MAFERVASVSDVREDEPLQVWIGETPVALVRCDGDICAVHDICTHEHAHLSEGFIESCQIECPLHGSIFDLRTGEALTLPAIAPLPTYQVKVEGDDVMIEVPE